MLTRLGCCSSVVPIRMLERARQHAINGSGRLAHGFDGDRAVAGGGMDITLCNKGGRTALRFAAGGGDVRTVQLLLEKAKSMGHLPEVVGAAGPSLAIAASEGFPNIVELLLAHGAHPNQANGTRGHGLNAALLAGHTDIARKLVTHGSDLDNRINPEKFPPPYSPLTRNWTTLRSCKCWLITTRISVRPTNTARPRLPGPGCVGTAS